MILKTYFGAVTTSIDEVRPTLWNTPAGGGDQEQAVILEQYKVYVEMADWISARRSLTNTFFLTLNTAIFAAIGTLLRDPHVVAAWLLVFPLLALLVQCFAWFFPGPVLSTAQFGQIHGRRRAGGTVARLPILERRMESARDGKDKAKYWPLTHLEQWIPVLFAATYIATFIAVAAR